ncbi:unnamed protein product [Rhizophagus irregularis]|uniref:Uncharacterized protein n=1 Tax=Rhizophagus irregularis TaxID=588596 RepID=A0A915YZS9_9GLOM|nr:unnamed protein product [Rhizophagus irregularis]
MDTSRQTEVKNLWIDYDHSDYQMHATIFSTDSTESDENTSILKKINIIDLEKRKEVYGICGECNEPAAWPEGNVVSWDIEKQKWERCPDRKVALKSLDNSSNINNDFLNEIKYYISGHFHFVNTVICYGITQDPDTQNYMMPVNPTDYLSSFQETVSTTLINPISESVSERLNYELNELGEIGYFL